MPANEITLNSQKYRVDGVTARLISRFPRKQVIGDISYDTEEYLSSWIQKDGRVGILVEEMDERRQGESSWWSNLIQSYAGHKTLPRLATSVSLPTLPTITDAGVETWISATNLTNWTETITGSCTVNRLSASPIAGTYSARLTVQTSGYAEITQTLGSWSNNYRSTQVRLTAQVRCDGASTVRLSIYDGIGTSYSSYHTGGGATETLSVYRTLSSTATELTIGVRATWNSNDGVNADCDTFTISSIGSLSGIYENYNNLMYFAAGKCLLKVNASGTVLFVGDVGTTITDLTKGKGNVLYIAIGDSGNYWYMSTAEAFTETNVSNAYYFIPGNNELIKINSSGQSWYAATPNSATPTWTTAGDIGELTAGDALKPFRHRNPSGTEVVYVPTKNVLYEHDRTNTKWLPTRINLNNHPNGGKGAVSWKDAMYLSAGLEVRKITVTSSDLGVQAMGLDREGSLPNEYNGEIVKLIPGENELIALVGSNQVTGTQTSGVYAYDSFGWQCWWISGSTETAMGGGIFTSAYGYRFYFDDNATLYYIDIPRGIKNPMKLPASFPYGSSGVHISPWFDGGTAVFDKLALRWKIETSGCSSTETVTCKYRINHTNTDLDTGWTIAGTITSNGTTIYTFGTNGVGITFRDFQKRFDLVRAAGTTTNTPDIRSSALSYMKDIDLVWAWSFNVIIAQPYNGVSPATMETNLQTVVNSSTLVDFLFRDGETKYVKALPTLQEKVTTGSKVQGMVAMTVFEP